MPIWLGKFIASRILKAIKHKIDLNRIDKYVNKPNELDKKVKVLEKEIKKLKVKSHPRADFVCMKCGCKAKRVEKVTKKRRK